MDRIAWADNIPTDFAPTKMLTPEKGRAWGYNAPTQHVTTETDRKNLMRLYLIRHGQSVENTQAWDGRNSNSPLTDLGQAQAKALGLWVGEHLKLDVLYASPMQRTRQTAAALSEALDIQPSFDDRLREVGNAYPDGRAFPEDQLPRYFVTVWGSQQPYKAISEGGENWMQFRARIGDFVEWLLAQRPDEHLNYQVGVVCHGGVIEGVFEHVFQKGPISTVNVQSHNTGVTCLEYYPTEGRPDWWLYYHNQTRHLAMDQIT